MVIVESQSELKKAMELREKQIRIVGPFAKEVAEKFRKKKRIKKGALITGCGLMAAGLIAAPFTGGASLGGTAMGLTMTGLTVGTVTLTTAELAIICGTVVSLYGIYKGAKVKIGVDPASKMTIVDIDATKIKGL